MLLSSPSERLPRKLTRIYREAGTFGLLGRAAGKAREIVAGSFRKVAPVWPLPGWVRFGHLRRVTPIGRHYGLDRGMRGSPGLPIDRYYIERFLTSHAADIRGHVLEIADNSYTRRYGGGRVTRGDVLHVAEQGPGVTLVGDLSTGENLPSERFDAIIATQTLQFIYDVPAAVRTLFRILKPGGVALVTIPGISQIMRHDMDHWGQYWTFTTASARRLFEPHFGAENVGVTAHGNVLSATAFLHGLAVGELRAEELDCVDRDYEFLITIRAEKAIR